MDKPKVYKVKNLGKPIYHNWNYELFTAKQKKKWDKYFEHELDDRGSEEQRIIKSMPIATRMSKWATAMGYGVDEMLEKMKNGTITQLPANYSPVNKFVLKAGSNLLEESQVKHFRGLGMERKAIEQKLKPGQAKAEIHYEGVLEITEPNATEIAEFLAGITTRTEDALLEKNKCDICGLVAKTENGLATHKRLKHADKNVS